jgi:hypothetical protein
MNQLKKQPVVSWMTLAGLVAAAMLFLLLLGHWGESATGASYDHSPEVTNAVAGIHAAAAGRPVAAAVSSRFAVFKRAQAAEDQMGARDQGALATHFYADQTHLAKRLAPISGVGAPVADRVYVAAGVGDNVCVMYLTPDAEGPGGQCVSPDVAASGRSVLTVEHGAGAEVFGLVADGVKSVVVTLASGATVEAPVTDNVYSVLVPTPSATVTLDSPSGRVTVDAPSG